MSLMGGWLTTVVAVLTLGALVLAVRQRGRRWRRAWLPLLVALGGLGAFGAHWLMTDIGMASEPAPAEVWVWVALTVLAVGVVAAGRPRTQLAVFAASFCLLSTGLAINTWIGYYPTVHTAWSQLASRPLPGQLPWATAEAMRRDGTVPARGVFVGVDTGSAASGFDHRGEYVYLPPAWFTGTGALPAVLMIGGEFNTPADWVRAGDADRALNAYAAAHDGVAPVAVFADSTGSFANDTECVNGPRGRAEDHLVGDVVPFVDGRFGTGARWGVAGFSTGGTCALDLALRHPDLFGAFVDIAGDAGPNAGTHAQTVDRLFGGDEAAWAASDPATLLAGPRRYDGTAGRFVVPDTARADPADGLCAAGRARGMDCAVTAMTGRHTWPFAARAFAATLPWLTAALPRTTEKPPL
jgi:S-formylglutathione hydrolase FrmB